MNLATVMDQLKTQLATITDLRTYAFPTDTVAVPAAIVGYPETITYDTAYGRGLDQMDIPVIVLVSRVTDRAARDVLAPYLSGAGARSVKQVLQAGTYTGFASVRVRQVTVDVITVAAVDYLAGVFSLDVYGSGA